MTKKSSTIIGKICDKHPELGGRRLKTHDCVACHADHCAAWKAKNRDHWLKVCAESQKRYRARKKLTRHSPRSGSVVQLVRP